MARVAAGPPGVAIDLGHDPIVTLDARGPMLRVQQIGTPLTAGSNPGMADRHIDIPRHALPHLLRAVQADLVGFLAALHPWVKRIAADLADPFTNAVDQRLQISTPLAL